MGKESIASYNSSFAVRLRLCIDKKARVGLLKESEEKEARKKESEIIGELAEHIGATRQAVSQYRNGTVAPNIEKLVSIADYFNVSCDYLLGGADCKTADNEAIRKAIGLTDESINALKVLQKESSEKNPTLARLQNHARKRNCIIIDKMISSKKISPLLSAIWEYSVKKRDFQNDNAFNEFYNMCEKKLKSLDDELWSYISPYVLSPNDHLVLFQDKCHEAAKKLIEDTADRVVFECKEAAANGQHNTQNE